MDAGKISGAFSQVHTGPVRSAAAQSVADAEISDTFTPDQQSAAFSGTSAMKHLQGASLTEVLLSKGTKPAFDMTPLWEVPRRSGISPQPNIGPHGEINASTFGNFTVVKDGDTIFSTELKDPTNKYPAMRDLAVNQPPAFTEDGCAYVPDRSGRLHGFDITKKEKIWAFNTKCDEGVTSPVIRDNKVIFRDGDGYLYALDRKTGKPIWDLKKWAFAFKAEPNTIPSPQNHPPALAPDGTLYITGKNGTIYAVDSETGKIKKDFNAFQAGRSIYFSFGPVCDNDGRVYVPARESDKDPMKLVCLDGKTGDKLWEVSTGGPVTPPIFGNDGIVYVGTKGPVWIRPDDAGESQKVMVLDGKTGKNLREFPIDGRIEQLALDPAGSNVAVLHTKIIPIPEWEEIEEKNSVTLIDTATQVVRQNVKQSTGEKDGIHSIAFSPDGSLIQYGYPDTIRGYKINSENLFVTEDGKALKGEDMQGLSQCSDEKNGTEENEKTIEIQDSMVVVDGVKLQKKGTDSNINK
ncbi:MAG: PQQ-binding-like beta-propeller repeat protein [Candidatus Xenobiia bacterium LiM19]